MKRDLVDELRKHGIQPSAQRVAVARVVLATEAHPSADQVYAAVKATFRMISRATVYNTLNLFVEKGLLREVVVTPGRVVFDPHVAPHHHFVDDDTGEIHDVPWDAIVVRNVERLEGFQVRDYQVVVRGRRTRRPGRRST